MKKELFEEFEHFQFGVLFELEKKIDYTFYSKTQSRCCGLIGEMLLNIYASYAIDVRKTNIKHLQVVFFKDTDSLEAKLTPHFKINSVNVIIPSNNSYIPYLSVVLQGIIENASNRNNYEIIVLSDDITELNKKILISQINHSENFYIKFLSPSKIIGNQKFKAYYSHYSKEIFYKILAPFILKNYKKAVILDCDLVVKKDIAKLYELNLNKKIIGGVVDVVYQGWLNGVNQEIMPYSKEILKLINPYNYINSGVFVIDLEKYRAKIQFDDLIKLCCKKYYGQDQDVLNSVFENEIFHIDPKWNVFIPNNPSVQFSINNACQKDFMGYEKARDNPYILHFAAKPKPWETRYMKDAPLWWNEARKNPFYETFLIRLKNSKYDKPVLKSKFGTLIDKVFPLHSKRRSIIKKILKKTFIWKKLFHMYHKNFN